MKQDRITETRGDFQRLQMKEGKYRARDFYPRMSPEVERLFQEWLKQQQAH